MSVIDTSDAHPCAPTVRQGMCIATMTHLPAVLALVIARQELGPGRDLGPDERAVFGLARRVIGQVAHDERRAGSRHSGQDRTGGGVINPRVTDDREVSGCGRGR